MCGCDLGEVVLVQKALLRGKNRRERSIEIDELRAWNTVTTSNKMIYVSQKLQELVEVAQVTSSDDDVWVL